MASNSTYNPHTDLPIISYRYHIYPMKSMASMRLNNATETQNSKRTQSLAHQLDEQDEPQGVSSMWAFLWCCPHCATWNVNYAHGSTIKNNILNGAFKSQWRITGNACEGCGKKGQTVNSNRNSYVFAVVSATKSGQVRDLKAVAENLNAIQEAEGRVCNEHDVNKSWFETTKHSGNKQGKGKKYWAIPLRRWKSWVLYKEFGF